MLENFNIPVGPEHFTTDIIKGLFQESASMRAHFLEVFGIPSEDAEKTVLHSPFPPQGEEKGNAPVDFALECGNEFLIMVDDKPWLDVPAETLTAVYRGQIEACKKVLASCGRAKKFLFFLTTTPSVAESLRRVFKEVFGVISIPDSADTPIKYQDGGIGFVALSWEGLLLFLRNALKAAPEYERLFDNLEKFIRSAQTGVSASSQTVPEKEERIPARDEILRAAVRANELFWETARPLFRDLNLLPPANAQRSSFQNSYTVSPIGAFSWGFVPMMAVFGNLLRTAECPFQFSVLVSGPRSKRFPGESGTNPFAARLATPLFRQDDDLTRGFFTSLGFQHCFQPAGERYARVFNLRPDDWTDPQKIAGEAVSILREIIRKIESGRVGK